MYITGWRGGQAYNGRGIAGYWKNGNPVTLPTDSREPHINSIAVYGNDVYLVGEDYDYGSTNYMVAKWWRNGVAVPLSSVSGSAAANSIVILPC